MSSKTKGIEKRSEINKLKDNVSKLSTNLNMLMMYFREQEILEHYIEWVKSGANETEKPPKLILPEKPKSTEDE
tara:strand:+ start:2738 stop:2959 length:222 start_codon:yes stop_codon:yes gene_type:complete